MKCREIIEKLNQLAPEHIACGWDNPGLLAGRRDKAVKRILAAVDADRRCGGGSDRERGRYASDSSSSDF